MMKIMAVLASLLSMDGGGISKASELLIPEGDTMVYFSFSKGGGMDRFGGFKYQIEATKDGRVHFLFNEGYPDEKEYYSDDHSVFDSLDKIVRKYDMVNYESNYRPEMRVFDGQSWSLYIKYASNTRISSGGYMAGPDNWRKAQDEIHECLKPWKEFPVPVNELIRFKYTYGDTAYLLERKEDHALLTVDDEKEGRHEVEEKDLKILEELRIIANIEQLKENRVMTSDDPSSTPFFFELEYADGQRYSYRSYDLKYKCHYTEVLQYFFFRWMSDKQ